MSKNLIISGFSDEISSNFDEQLQVVRQLGMSYISLRGIDGKNINEYSIEEVETSILPRLKSYGVKVSSIGSPIGKIFIDDEEGFSKQLDDLERLCKICHLLDCQYIRMFSFYIAKDKNYDDYKDLVVKKLKNFTQIAEKHNIILLHENEKDIYGDIGRRCKVLFDEVNSKHFKAIFDFANFVQCKEDVMDCYNMLKQDVVYFHIKDATTSDNQNVVCGTGEGRIEEILKIAINDGYEGFLTLEPHLVIFDSLKDLELEDVTEIIKDNKNLEGKDGYKLQYDALNQILNNIC